MKLIGSHTSPYVRKVRVVLAEKKMEYEFVVDLPRNPGSAVPAINPLGRIPTLVLDDDTPLFDSRVIVEHIDAITPNNKLGGGNTYTINVTAPASVDRRRMGQELVEMIREFENSSGAVWSAA